MNDAAPSSDTATGEHGGDQDRPQPNNIPRRLWWLIAAFSMCLPWMAGPPLQWWPLACIAITPLLLAAEIPAINRRAYGGLYLAGVLFWAVSLQGLRHAHPLIYPFWIALSAYLGIYPVLFVVATRRVIRWGLPLPAAAVCCWVGSEAVRNYFITGISAAMLGHTMADVPLMIQIADLGGTYAVSAVLVMLNVAFYRLIGWAIAAKRPLAFSVAFPASPPHPLPPRPWSAVASAFVLLSATLSYGSWRLGQATQSSETAIALIGRNENVEWDQDASRELELFDAYSRESIRAVEQAQRNVAAIVWPESMFTGRMPWIDGQGSERFANDAGLTLAEMRLLMDERREGFRVRARSLQSVLAKANGNQTRPPELIGGCGVIRYDETVRGYSGVVHVNSAGDIDRWYGKQHLVMIGEYIPIVGWIPILKNLIPENMGLTSGDGPVTFQVGQLTLCPNVCIETAVERVSINQLRTLLARDGDLPDAIVTVTNDAWFDDSSVVTHHKRCAQLVAVACRRPVLSAANNGPTAWIDSYGRVVEQLPQGANGSVIATPSIDHRTAPVMYLADWPARLCALVVLAAVVRRTGPKRLRPQRQLAPS